MAKKRLVGDDDLRQPELTEGEFLAQYNPDQFERPSVTVDAVLFTVTDEAEPDVRKVPDKVLQVLLIRRAGHPFLGQWALPGGFVRLDESLDEAAMRTLREETGLGRIYLEQLYTWGDPQRDPRTRVISASYMALVDAAGLQVRPGERTAEARWFTVRESTLETTRTVTEGGYQERRIVQLTLSGGGDEVGARLAVTRRVEGTVTRVERAVPERDGLAFDHAQIIHYALERLRNKVEYTAIAFNLVGELFTIKELQKVYEVILGRELLNVQFRRDIDRKVLPTNEMRTDVGHRPARLYRFNQEWSEA